MIENKTQQSTVCLAVPIEGRGLVLPLPARGPERGSSTTRPAQRPAVFGGWAKGPAGGLSSGGGL